jgi:hypothetical protein
MEEEIKLHRILAVKRFKNGESPETICASLGKSKFWLYKCVKRYSESEPSWCVKLLIIIPGNHTHPYCLKIRSVIPNYIRMRKISIVVIGRHDN